MKKVLAIALAVVVLVTLVVPSVVLAKSPKTEFDANGPHYNLNLIGKDKEMPGEKDNPDRHTMFVPIDTSRMEIIKKGNGGTLPGIKIEMTQSDDPDGWAMIDGNATDQYGAFELAAGKYNVYIAVKAKKPGTSGLTDITGWVEAYDELGFAWIYINVGHVQVSKNGKWTDATGLFFVSDAEDPTGTVGATDMWVFDYMAALEAGDYSQTAYFWQFDNHGNKLIQVRFYPMN